MDLLTQIADNIALMTEPYSDMYEGVDAHGTRWVHRSIHDPLLQQLAEAMEPSGGTGADGHRVPASSPPARIDAIDRLRDINQMVGMWCYAGQTRMARDLKVSMRKLVGIPWRNRETIALDADVRLWLAWCRVLTGWDSPAWAPNEKCPACGMRGTLRIRLNLSTACCVDPNCRAAWDAQTIGYLAEAVRLATSGPLVLA